MRTTFKVDGASGAYKFALPLQNLEHLAFLKVSLKGAVVPFEMEGTKADAGVVVYSAEVGEPGDGAEIAVSVPLFEYSSPFARLFAFLRCWLLREELGVSGVRMLG